MKCLKGQSNKSVVWMFHLDIHTSFSPQLTLIPLLSLALMCALCFINSCTNLILPFLTAAMMGVVLNESVSSTLALCWMRDSTHLSRFSSFSQSLAQVINRAVC